MDKTLGQYAKEEKISHTTAWRRFHAGQIPNAKQTPLGIIIGDGTVAVTKPVTYEINTVAPAAVDWEGKIIKASTRSNKSALTSEVGRFQLIDEGLTPFTEKSYNNCSYVTIRDAVILCQKAFYNFPIFRNTLSLMANFSTSPIYLTGGTEKSRKFFNAWLEKINIGEFQLKFFLEFFRSSNVFLYRMDADIKPENIKDLTKRYGLAAKKKLKLPAKYILLNPADILVGGASNFVAPMFYKLLNPYELSRLRNPKNDEDQDIFNAMPPLVRESIKSKKMTDVVIELNPDLIYYIPFEKMDYEPLAVPLGFSVLDDLNRKEEMKRMDSQICRTMQQVVLLVKTGYETQDGKYMVNPNTITTLETIFKNQSVGRVLVTDFTTDVKFVIPEIAAILDPKKYEILDKDIAIGLNNIIGGGISNEKFANKAITVDIFVERLNQARQTLLDNFLQKEIRRVSKEFGFQDYPTAHMEKISLKNDLDYARIYSELAKIGFLTPEETISAINSGRLPTPEESEESQKKFKEFKDNELYAPVVSGKKEEEGTGMNGRPPGSKSPQTTKKITPVGGAQFSLKSVKKTLEEAGQLQANIEKTLLKKHKLKVLTEEQKDCALELSKVIMSNEPKEHWLKKASDYIKEPFDKNKEMVAAVQNVAFEHQIDDYTAAVLYHSKI